MAYSDQPPLDQSLEVLQTLARGVNPTTGERFPADSVYHDAIIVRALFTVLEHARTRGRRPPRSREERQARNLDRGRPGNAGLPWQEEDRKRLAELFASGAGPTELGADLGRSRGAVIAELLRQGLVDELEAQRLRTTKSTS